MAAERPDVTFILLAVDFLSPAALNAALHHLSTSLATGARCSASLPSFLQTCATAQTDPNLDSSCMTSRASWVGFAGTLQPLCNIVHSLDSTQAGLRQMSQARQVGKVVVSSQQAKVSRYADVIRIEVVIGLNYFLKKRIPCHQQHCRRNYGPMHDCFCCR